MWGRSNPTATEESEIVSGRCGGTVKEKVWWSYTCQKSVNNSCSSSTESHSDIASD